MTYRVDIDGAGREQVTATPTGVVAPWIQFAGAVRLALTCAVLSQRLIEAPAIRVGHKVIAFFDRS